MIPVFLRNNCLVMNPFDLITDDNLIYLMCENWDTGPLLNMSEVYKRIYLVCKPIIDKRSQERLNKIKKNLEKAKQRIPYHRVNPKSSFLLGFPIRFYFNSRKIKQAFWYIPSHKIAGTYQEVESMLKDFGYTSKESKDIIFKDGFRHTDKMRSKIYRDALKEEKDRLTSLVEN